ncbi:MAG: histidine triad nucleotide-binding protein [Bdellovibrionales bacterium]|nr:histidine triad nucleotide-binding protein [Bdellovibrionales bacterium]
MSIFEKIIQKEIPANIVFEDDLCLAFTDISPKAPVHILIIPKTPIPTAADLKPEHASLMGHLMIKATEIAKEQGLAEHGYRLVINCKDHGGQEVYHLHIHLLGGKKLYGLPV